MKKLQLPIPVKEMARSLEFYWTLFGADPIWASDELAWFDLPDPHVHLYLKQREREERGTHRILWVASENFVVSERQRLDDWGLLTDDPSDIGCYYPNDSAMWVRDPDGNRLNIYCRQEVPQAPPAPRAYLVSVSSDGYFYSCAGPVLSQEPRE